jgi:hypothetical protein
VSTPFRIEGRELDAATGVVSLHYSLGEWRFAERIDFGPLPDGLPPARRAAFERALDLLLAVAGVSYFKVSDPDAIDGPGARRLTPEARELLAALYGEGLAEFRAVNGIPVDRRPSLPPAAADPPAPGPSPAGLGDGVLVPVGGGKDSIVTLEALKDRFDVAAFSVGTPQPIVRTVAIAGVAHRVVRRTLAPELFELNARGEALNGHVPVTAIVALIAAATAILDGRGTVAMSNERSASEGSYEVDGVVVNHQFSKGAVAERLLAEAVRASVAPDLTCFSFLRPASELAIARAFARLPAYRTAFTSCNAVFRLDPERRARRWCGDCPKCRFVYLILAPYLGPEALREVFGADLLADEAQLPGFRELAGIGAVKPFECVGEQDESRAAVRMLAADPRWARRPVVRALAEALDGTPTPAAEELLALAPTPGYPARFEEALRAALGA